MKMELYYVTKVPFGADESTNERIYVAGPFGTYMDALDTQRHLEDNWKYQIDTQVVELVRS